MKIKNFFIHTGKMLSYLVLYAAIIIIGLIAISRYENNMTLYYFLNAGVYLISIFIAYMFNKKSNSFIFGFSRMKKMSWLLTIYITFVMLTPLLFYKVEISDMKLFFLSLLSQLIISIAEEIYYRGVLFREGTKINYFSAILITSILFIHWGDYGSFQENMLVYSNSFLISVLFCLLTLYSKSLLPAIFFHVLVNFVEMAVPQLSDGFFLFSILFLPAIIYLVILLKKENLLFFKSMD